MTTVLVDLDPKDRTPIYAQLERGLRAAIATGRLNVGDQLPTVRQLAVELRVNANTVARVYSELERAGVLETRRGVGTFVRLSAAKVRTPVEHSRQLRSFATKVLADGLAAGFTVADIVSQLDELGRERRENDEGGGQEASVGHGRQEASKRSEATLSPDRVSITKLVSLDRLAKEGA